MRLLNVHTRRLHEFSDGAILQYAILSHTWGDDEVTFQDLNPAPCPYHLHESEDARRQIMVEWDRRVRAKAGYAKIEGCCREAIKNGIHWVWVDTCCIDKSSSSELQEAINSMYRWYQSATVCYAYLIDVPLQDDYRLPDSAFRNSRWFTRGWTLQELIAPRKVIFYNTEWLYIGTRSSLGSIIGEVTAISMDKCGPDTNLDAVSVAVRMSWASNRRTTRVEDGAYCLMGLFDVNMPLLYGEGEKAFLRLQEAIMAASDDQSLFAWGYEWPNPRIDHFYRTYPASNRSYLPSSPSAFSGCSGIAFWDPGNHCDTFTMTQKGVRLSLPLQLCQIPGAGRYWFCFLNCGLDNERLLAVPLEADAAGLSDSTENVKLLRRVTTGIPFLVDRSTLTSAATAGRQTIFLSRRSWIPSTTISWDRMKYTRLGLEEINIAAGYFLSGLLPIQAVPSVSLGLCQFVEGGPFLAVLHIGSQQGSGALVVFTRRGHGQDYRSTFAVFLAPHDFCMVSAMVEEDFFRGLVSSGQTDSSYQFQLVSPSDDGSFPIGPSAVLTVEISDGEERRHYKGMAKVAANISITSSWCPP